MVGSLRPVHHEESRTGEAAARQQRLDAFSQPGVVEWCELVEQGRDPGRIDEQHQQIESAPEDPNVEPPQATHSLHQPEHGEQHWRPDEDAQSQLLHQVDKKESERHAVEAKLLFDDELTIERERQIEESGNGDDAENHDHAVDEAVESRRPEVVQRLEAATEGEGEQDGDLGDKACTTEAGACHGVVSSLLMRAKCDPISKSGGNLLAVRADVRNLTACQP